MKDVRRYAEQSLKRHRRELERYMTEVAEANKGTLTKEKARQMSYSYQKANTELAVVDALEYILKHK